MAVNNPLRLAGSELRKMTDTELEDLSRLLRLAYAQRLAYSIDPVASNESSYPNNSNANIVVGDVWSNIGSYESWKTHDHLLLGSMSDTYMLSQTTSRANNDDPSSDTPNIPGDLLVDTNQSFFMSQYLGKPGVVHLKPDNNVKRTFSYLVSKGGADIAPETDDQNIIDTIFKHTHDEMLNGDGLGTYKVATSKPGTTTHYDTWSQVQTNFYVDSISSGSYPYDSTSTSVNATFSLWLNVGSSSGSTSPGAITSLTQQNQPLTYRNYQTSMQSGTAVISNGNQIDDYYLEGTYRGTVYIKPTDSNGIPSWSTDNGTYTTLSVDTGSEFNTTNNHLGQHSKSTIFYPSGSSSDGYCRVRLNRALEMTIGYNTDNLFGVGLAGGSYFTDRIYKFTYEPNVTQGEFTAPQTFNALGNYLEHDQYRQSNVRRLGLLCNVLLPLFENTDASGNQNYPIYRIDDSSVDNGSTIRDRGTLTDTRENSSSIRDTLIGGTYYKTRYGSGTATAVSTKHFSIESKIGVR